MKIKYTYIPAMKFANVSALTAISVPVTVPTSELAVLLINLHSKCFIYILKHIPEIS